MNNVLIVENSSGFGGSANSLANLITHLNKSKFHPIILLKKFGSQIDKIKNAEIVKFKDYNEPGKLSSFKYSLCFIKDILSEAIKICFIIKKRQISLIHVNSNIITGIPAIMASRIVNVPCICHIRQTRKLIKRERFFAKFVNEFIILNKNAYEILRKDIPKEKLNIIYNGLDLQVFDNIERGNFKKEFNLYSSPILALVGRIVKGKGVKEFILAGKEVLKVKPNVKLVIVGDAKGEDDRYYKEVKQLVEKENLNQSVIFTGWRNDLNKLIVDFDILVHPYTYPEGLPNVLIEAMALKKSVITTNVPGSSEIVVDGVTGFLVAPGDIDAMVKKIIYLIDNPDLARQMGEKGRKRVEQYFNIKNTVAKIQELYMNILHN